MRGSHRFIGFAKPILPDYPLNMDSRAPGGRRLPVKRGSPDRCLAHETIFRNGEIILKPTAVYQGSLVLAGVQDEFDGRGRSSTSWVMQRRHLFGARRRGLQHPIEAPLGGCVCGPMPSAIGGVMRPHCRGPVRTNPLSPRCRTFHAPAPGFCHYKTTSGAWVSRVIFPLSIVSRLVRESAGADGDAFRLLRLRGTK